MGLTMGRRHPAYIAKWDPGKQAYDDASDISPCGSRTERHDICAQPATRILGWVDLCERHYRMAMRDALRGLHDRCKENVAELRGRLDRANDRHAEFVETLGRKGVVYYLRRADGLIKIGTTGDYRKRLGDLTREHGPLSLLAVQQGYAAEEDEMHKRFAHLRVTGEWFRPAPDLFAWIVHLRLALARRELNPASAVPVTQIRNLIFAEVLAGPAA
jgi:hypothetical protein